MDGISRGTKAFSQRSQSGYPGSFPVGFLKWVQDRWWGDKRIYLCSGGVIDEAADKVDIQEEISDEVLGRRGHNATTKRSRTLKTTANIIADARETGIPDESYDWVMIDPPYSKSLARDLYGTEEVFSDLNKFVDEGARLCKPGGYVCVLAYDIPKKPQGFELAAVWGIYQIPAVRYMTAFFVFKKWGEREAQGLRRFE